MDDLALQIGERHIIAIDDAERADAGRGEVEQDRRTEAARPNDENLGRLELRLARSPDILEHDVPRIAFQFLARELHQLCPVEPKPPAPRAVLESSDCSANRTRVTGEMIIWAMRSPRLTAKDASP